MAGAGFGRGRLKGWRGGIPEALHAHQRQDARCRALRGSPLHVGGSRGAEERAARRRWSQKEHSGSALLRAVSRALRCSLVIAAPRQASHQSRSSSKSEKTCAWLAREMDQCSNALPLVARDGGRGGAGLATPPTQHRALRGSLEMLDWRLLLSKGRQEAPPPRGGPLTHRLDLAPCTPPPWPTARIPRCNNLPCHVWRESLRGRRLRLCQPGPTFLLGADPPPSRVQPPTHHPAHPLHAQSYYRAFSASQRPCTQRTRTNPLACPQAKPRPPNAACKVTESSCQTAWGASHPGLVARWERWEGDRSSSPPGAPCGLKPHGPHSASGWKRAGGGAGAPLLAPSHALP